MGIQTPNHPEITSGGLDNFGFHKIKRQIKSIYVNMITDFFSDITKIQKLDIPELAEVSNINGSAPKLFIERDFPYTARKIPLIVPIISNINELKSYLGNDNYLYPGVDENPDGTRSGYDVYANMYNVAIKILVVTESNELRDQLIDLLLACFTNYYRGNYTYRDDSDNEFIITLSSNKVVSGNDSEVAEANTTNLIFYGDISLTAFIEYHYKAYGEGRYSQIKNINIDPLSGPTP